MTDPDGRHTPRRAEIRIVTAEIDVPPHHLVTVVGHIDTDGAAWSTVWICERRFKGMSLPLNVSTARALSVALQLAAEVAS